MSISMNILASENFNQSDYIIFLKEIGAELEDETGMKSTLYSDDAQVWICREDYLIKEYEDGDLISVGKKLKATPRSLIALELNSDVGSAKLALRFAYNIGKKWGIVVDDLYEHIYSFSEIENLYKRGRSFE